MDEARIKKDFYLCLGRTIQASKHWAGIALSSEDPLGHWWPHARALRQESFSLGNSTQYGNSCLTPKQSLFLFHSCSQAEICELSGSLYTSNANKSFKIKLIQQRGRNSVERYVDIFITSKWTIHFKWLIPLHCNLCLVLANETN